MEESDLELTKQAFGVLLISNSVNFSFLHKGNSLLCYSLLFSSFKVFHIELMQVSDITCLIPRCNG